MDAPPELLRRLAARDIASQGFDGSIEVGTSIVKSLDPLVIPNDRSQLSIHHVLFSTRFDVHIIYFPSAMV